MSAPSLDEQIRSHLETLEAAPGDHGAFRALEDLFEKTSRWDDLIHLYEGRARLLPEPGAPYLAKAADLAHQKLRNAARAEALFRQLLHSDPRNPVALHSMVALSEEKEDWPALAAALEQEAQAAADPCEAARAWLRLGIVQEERLGRRDRAALLYARSFRLDPRLDEARTRAIGCFTQLRRFAQAKRFLDGARDAGAEPRALAAEYARLGAVLADEPLQHDLAMDALIEALSLDRATAGSSELRDRLRAFPRVWREEVRALEGRAAKATDRREAAALHLRIAQIHAAYDPDGAPRVSGRVERAWALAPGSALALDLLERAWAERNDFRGLADAIARLAGGTRDRAAAVTLQLRLAQVDLVHFGDAASALSALERALELDPACESAALQAFEHHVDAGRVAEALSVLERHLAAAPEKPQHAMLRTHAAAMARDKLGDPARARRHLEAALRADPGHTPAAAALAPLLADAGEWQRLVEVLELRLPGEPDPGERIRILERIAEVQQDHLARPRDALRTLSRAMAIDPRRAATRKAMEGAAARADAFLELARAYRSAAEAVGDDLKARKTLLRRVAEIFDRDLAMPEEAVKAYRELVALDPEDRGAAAALEGCLARAGQHQEVARGLEARVAAADGADRRDAAMKLARLWQEAAEPERAAAVWRELLATQPDDVEALWGLHAALEATPGPHPAEERVQVLARLAARAKGHAQRAALELERATVLADPLERLGEAAGAAIAVLQAGGLTAGQQSEAIALLERMLARGVDPLRIAQVLAPLHAAAGDVDKQVAMLELIARRLPPEAEARERARFLLDASTLRAERLGDPRGALSSAAAALRACPDHAEARRRCEQLAAQVGAYGELFALLVEAARRLEGRPEEELALRLRAAAVAEEDLGSSDDAGAQLRRCLALRPDDSAILAALTRVALAAEHWDEAAELLRERSRRAAGPERVALLTQLAEVLLDRKHSPEGAAEIYREVLALAPPDGRPRLLARLAAALGEAGDRAGQAQALEELSRAARDPAEAVRASVESARLQAGMGDAMGAVARLRGALETAPDDTEALVELERRLEESKNPAVTAVAARALADRHARRGDPRRRILALEALARAAPDLGSRAAAQREIAAVCERDLHQLSLAFAAMAEAARATPGDPEVRRELRRLADEGHDAEACARVYDELVSEASPEDAQIFLKERAEWIERRLDGARAAQAWASVLLLAPGDLEANEALRRIHRAAERWPELVQSCLEVGHRAPVPSARAEALREAARVAESRLGDIERAAAVWREVAAIDPSDAEAEAALTRAAEKLDRPAELAEALEARLARGADPEAAFKLAELRRTRLGDAAGALALHADLLAADPGRTGSRDALAELAATPGAVGREALQIADAALRAAGEHARRVAAREGRLAAVDEPAERARLLAEIRAILERDLSDAAAAFVAAGRAFAEGGLARAEANEDLVRLAAATGRQAELAAACENAAAVAAPGEAAELLRRAAGVYESELRDGAAAIAAWRGVLEAAPDDAEALEALERLYAAARSAGDLLELARRRAALASGPDRAQHLLRAAELAESLGDAAAALEALREVLAVEPGHLGALEALDRILGRERRAAEQVEVLESLGEALREIDPGRRIQALLRRAALLEEDPDPRRSVEAYAEILAESPREPGAVAGLERLLGRPDAREDAVRMLEDVHRLAGDARRLAALLEQRLETADAAERAPLLAEVAALHERLGDKRRAFQARLRTFREAAGAGQDVPAVRAELDRLAAETGAFGELSAALEEALAAGLAGPAALDVKRRLATLCAERLQRPDDAARWFEEVAAAAPSAEVLGALARVYRRQGAYRELAGTLTRLADVSSAAAARKELLLEVAKIMEEHLSDRDGAIQAYRKILSVDPEDPNALRLLGKALGSAERWEDLVEVLAREVAIADRRPNFVAEAAELRFRLGRIRHHRLADAEGALHLYREVLEKVPRHPAALAALEDLARTSGPAAIEAATILEPIYAKEGEHQKLIETLEARAANETDPGARAALLRRIAEVYGGPLRNSEMAFLASGRALATDPDAPESLELAVRFGSEAGAGEELFGLLAENADRARDPAARAEYQRWIARASSGDPARSAEAWRHLLDLAPDDREAIAGLCEALRGGDDAPALAQALRRALAVEEDAPVRAQHLSELAQIQEERLGDAAGAIATLKRLLELEPAQRDALARLDRLCVRTEKWVELADVLTRELTAAVDARDAKEAVAFAYRLGELKETRLLDRDGAIALYEEVLATRPDHPETIARLEAMLQKDPANSRAARALEGAYGAAGDPAKQAAVLELRASERPDPTERKALWVALAELREKRLGDPEMAFLALCKAFREDPSDRAVRERMTALGEASGHDEELAAIIEDELPRLPPADAAAAALKLGMLYEDKLGEPTTAAAHLRRAVALDAAVAREALPALERLYQKLEAWPELADALQARADHAVGPEKVQLLARLGQLCEERLGSPDRAAQAYEAAIQADPRHLPSLRALEVLYEGAGRKEDLLRVLAPQRTSADPTRKEQVLAKMAALCADLDRPEESIALWKEVLALRPRQEHALAALEDLYERLERWQDLAQHLRLRVTATVDRREIARLNDKLGRLLGTRLGDAHQAIQSFKAVLDSDPKNRRALESLRDIYATQGDLDGLAATYRRLVAVQEHAAGVKAVRLELAEVLSRAGHKRDATEQAKLAFDIEPHQVEELVRIEEVFRSTGAAAEGVRVAEARAAVLAAQGGPAEAVPAWLAVADLWRAQKRSEAAGAALEKVLELDPANRTAYEQLRTIHAEAGNWRAYARISDLFAPQISDPLEKIALLEEVAGIHEKRLGQKEMAFLAWCRALGEAPDSETAIAEAGRLAAETEAEDELAAVLEQVAEDARGITKAKVLLRLGKLRDEKLDDADGAEAAFRRALEADPASAEALEGLAQLFKRRGRVRDLVIALEQKLEAASGLEEKKTTLIEAAKIYDGELHDVDEAVAALRRVLELDGGDTAALDALCAIYRRERRWEDLAGILARARDLAPSDEVRIGYQLEIAGLYESEIADDEAAVEGYRTVLGMDDRNADALAGLERLYTKLDRLAELNRVYEKQIELAEDPRDRIRILGKSAQIFEEKLHDPLRAIGRNEEILRLDGGNLPAVKSLERLYRTEGEWEKLITLMQHHLTLVQDRRETVALEVAIGEVWYEQLARVDRAEAIFNHALKLDPESRDAVSALGRLYERSGNWNLALDMLRREARLARASKDAVDIQVRMGAIFEDMLLDTGSARQAYQRALQLDPGSIDAIRRMKGIAERERDRETFLEMLISEARYAEDPEEKTRLYTEVARVYQDEHEDRDQAARYYEEALKRTPDYLDAARPLSDLYVAASRWGDAERVLEGMVETLAAGGEPKELCRQSYRLGYVAEKLGKKDRALECYRRAYQLDSTYLPALEGLGNLLVQVEQWEEALRVFTAILIHHSQGLTDLEVVETHWQIGEIAFRLGQQERAANAFKKALEIDANHAPSRQSLIRILEETGQFEEAVEQRQRLVPLLEGQAKLEMYLAIGEACRDRLKDPYQAIDAFLGASRIDPASLAATEALLGLYRETRQGQKAADVLGQILARPEAQADPQRAAKLHATLGEILRDEVKDETAAVAEFEKALDRNPRLVSAFAALEELLAKAKKWPELEQAYVKMIQRLPKTPDVAQARLALWKTLGELYRNVLRNDDGARMAYQVVSRADPDDAVSTELYAQLAAKKPGEEAEAIVAYRALLRTGAKAQKAASALVGLHAARKEYDQAYSSAQVLAHLLSAATPEELQVVSRLRKFARDQASRVMDDAAWRLLLHERVRGPLAEIMTLLALHARSMFVQAPRDLGLNLKKDELDVAGSMLFFVNMFKYVARTLGMEGLRLFRKDEVTARLQVLPTDPPGLLASEDMFRERPKKELWFAIGKTLAFRRPELFLARLMPHDQLDLVFQAACSVGTSRFVITADPHQVEKLKITLEKALPENVRRNTLKLLARSYCDVQHPGDVRAYLDGAELSSNRVGALLAGDLEVVKKGVVSEKAQVSKLRDDTKIKDLALFCVSEEYAQLRERLGLSVVVPG